MTRLLLAMPLPVVAHPSLLAEAGGVKDTSGLVWSKSQKRETGLWWSWAPATTNAANYSIVDFDATGALKTYDDWRLPTAHEIQAAIQNGTLFQIMPSGPNGPYYTKYLDLDFGNSGEQRLDGPDHQRSQ